MPKEYENFINGRMVPAKSGKSYENRNPADQDDLVGVFPSKRKLPDLLARFGSGEFSDGISSFGSRHRAYVKVQDGCRMKCAYCAVPAGRGPERGSRSETKTRTCPSTGGTSSTPAIGSYLRTWSGTSSSSKSGDAKHTR